MSTLGCSQTSTIGSILTRTAANCSTISSVRRSVVEQNTRSSIPDSDGPVTLQLPEQWLWDIIDEFIYQYQVFCTWRAKIKNKTDDELSVLEDGTGVGHEILLLTCS